MLNPSIVLKAGMENNNAASLIFPDISLNPATIKTIMINEIVPDDFNDFFYSKPSEKTPENLSMAMLLFENAGYSIKSIEDIIEMGIYITTAVKQPKQGGDIDSRTIREHAVLLEQELKLFPNLKAIMLMGDVAKKSFNAIVKKETGKNVIPSGSTYKIRGDAYYYGGIRIFPSYIMTGKNIMIEKSKRIMIAEDIKNMMAI